MNVKEKINALRALMKQKNISIYYVPNEDDHLSEEYTATRFQCKSWLSGFTGDYGCLIVTPKWAGLWTDGRYFTQAEDELKDSGIELMRLRQPGIPNPLDYLVEHTPAKGVLGFDGHVVSAASALWLSEQLKAKKASLHMKDDLAGMVWGAERPAMPQDSLYLLPQKYTGESASQRIARVREKMAAAGADVLVITQLEDPCWMLNVRGNDIECTPIVYAFALVTKKNVYYYADAAKVPARVLAAFKSAHVTLRPYDALAADLAKWKNQVIWADLRTLNADLYDHISASNRILNAPSPIGMFRAVKNAVEIENLHRANIKDGVAMVKFLYWLKTNVGKIPMSEISAADKLYALRAEQKNYIEPSFPTIAGYKGNAAMMHYSASEKSNAEIHDDGFLLVDSGGTYCEGTTDITRTIACGKLSAKDKMYFTKVLKSNLRLASAKFLHGTTGHNLDILARGVIWDMDIDYQCGTGHGVGYVLSVHEGPHTIRWGNPRSGSSNAALEAGMVVTDEPGVYLPHKLGIRTENDLLVVSGANNFYGQFLQFEPLTLCPIDLDAVDVRYLNEEDLAALNAYHKMVWQKLSPSLSGKEKAWLRKATRALTK